MTILRQQAVYLGVGPRICYVVEHPSCGHFDDDTNWIRYELYAAKRYFTVEKEGDPDFFFLAQQNSDVAIETVDDDEQEGPDMTGTVRHHVDRSEAGHFDKEECKRDFQADRSIPVDDDNKALPENRRKNSDCSKKGVERVSGCGKRSKILDVTCEFFDQISTLAKRQLLLLRELT